ncbi:uncharacterized protein LOC115076106 [Rhinatrema bivittatum]|uniref:uncharacterized protein LOC115076106 n=1 Tax=Rhinatrema bivittatum TaxID=194408 RepID=UPI00112985E4|nr:uncharacterized protein LOC115076106 [Rhinatrema bivittatum]
MRQVFGDYRLKIYNERQQTEKAATKAMAVKIQERDSKNSGSIVYRKHSNEASETTGNWFSLSDNSFRFNFIPCEADLEVKNLGLEDLQAGGDHGQAYTDRPSPKPKDLERPMGLQNKMLACAGPGSQGSEFAFNFLIPEEDSSTPSSAKVLEVGDATREVASLLSPYLKLDISSESTVPSENSVSQDLRRTGEEGKLRQLCMKEKGTLHFENEANNKKTADMPKKKKKKKEKSLQNKAAEKSEDSERVKVGSSEHPDKEASDQDEASRLQREVDWCVEQLEFGLQRQKSTPKQVDEALKAIKILKSKKAALVKKRQIMRGMFGDYRKKMEEERQKQLRLMQAATKCAWVAEVKDPSQRNKSQVYRKSTWIAQQARRSAGSSSPLVQSVSPENTTGSLLPQDHILALDTPGPESFVFTHSEEQFCFNFF